MAFYIKPFNLPGEWTLMRLAQYEIKSEHLRHPINRSFPFFSKIHL
jgi:hypothetical protein